MQQEFLSTKVHHKLLKESKIFNACFFCMHANMMGYFFLDFILTTFFTLGHSIPSTYFKFGHFCITKNFSVSFFFHFQIKTGKYMYRNYVLKLAAESFKIITEF